MKGRKQAVKDEKPRVPTYIVTFSDMVTLLLTFFVLLLTLGVASEKALFEIGLDSFRDALIKFGMVGFSYGKMARPDFGHVKLKYIIDQQENIEQQRKRIIDAREEKNRRLFRNLSESMKTIPSQIVGKRPNFAIADVRFAEGEAALNESAKQFLATFCSELQADSGSKYITVYVVGFATSGWSEKKRWILSAQRAQAVTEFLKQTLPPQTDWRIYSWGAGRGGKWAPAAGGAQRQSHILIGVLESE